MTEIVLWIAVILVVWMVIASFAGLLTGKLLSWLSRNDRSDNYDLEKQD